MTRASDAQRLLRRARGHLEPEAGDAARVRQLIVEQLSSESGVHPSGPEGAPLAGSSGITKAGRAALPWSPGMSQLVLVGLSTGVVGFLLGLAVDRQPNIERVEAPSPAPRAVEAAPVAVLPEVPPVPSESRAPEAARAPEPAPSTQLEPPPRRASPARHAPRAAASKSAAEPLAPLRSPASDVTDANALTGRLDLRAALELLGRAEAERQAGRLEAALVLLSELEARAPELLVEERLVTAVLCECDRGNTSRARELAHAVAEANPSSIYARRLRASCASSER